jgi:hypothetical protein
MPRKVLARNFFAWEETFKSGPLKRLIEKVASSLIKMKPTLANFHQLLSEASRFVNYAVHTLTNRALREPPPPSGVVSVVFSGEDQNVKREMGVFTLGLLMYTETHFSEYIENHACIPFCEWMARILIPSAESCTENSETILLIAGILREYMREPSYPPNGAAFLAGKFWNYLSDGDRVIFPGEKNKT